MDTEDFTPPNSPRLTKRLVGNDEGAGTDFTTEGEVKTRRGHGGNEKTDEDKVRMTYYRAQTMLTVPSGAQTHLSLLLLPQSLSGCYFFQAAFTPTSSPIILPFKNYKDTVDISNMAARLTACFAENYMNILSKRCRERLGVNAAPF